VWVRPIAVACLAFVCLASGRGVVPAICANLGDTTAQAAWADQELRAVRSCCLATWAAPQPPKEDGEHAPRRGTGGKDCAFCSLAAARFEPLTQAVLPPPPEPADVAGPDLPPPHIACEAPCTHRGRAPPHPASA
jgi:hypothetical protein